MHTNGPSGRLSRLLAALHHYSPATHRVVFSVAAVWHILGARYFILSPFTVLRNVTIARPITFVAAELLQYIGALNIGYALLALQGLLLSDREGEGRKRAALVLSMASVSQVWFSFRFLRNGRWSLSGLLPILLGDALVGILTFAYYLQEERCNAPSPPQPEE